MILDILGGGGSGKTTLKFALLKLNQFAGFVPYTTRPKRPEEVNGVHYHFVSVREYNRQVLGLKRSANGWHYGVLAQDLESRADGRILVATFDINGISSLEKMGKTVKVVFLNIQESERKRRMLARGDDLVEVARRLEAGQQ